MGLSRFSPRQWFRALGALAMTFVNSNQDDASATPRESDSVSPFEVETFDLYVPARETRTTSVHLFVPPPAPAQGLEWRYG